MAGPTQLQSALSQLLGRKLLPPTFPAKRANFTAPVDTHSHESPHELPMSFAAPVPGGSLIERDSRGASCQGSPDMGCATLRTTSTLRVRYHRGTCV